MVRFIDDIKSRVNNVIIDVIICRYFLKFEYNVQHVSNTSNDSLKC